MYEFKYPVFGKWSLNVVTSSSSPYSVKLNFQSETSIRVRIVDEIWGDEGDTAASLEVEAACCPLEMQFYPQSAAAAGSAGQQPLRPATKR
jgi:hypothetical protein